MCTACGPFGPWVQAGSRPDFPGSLKGRPQHRSPRACRRHEHTRRLPPHGKADPAPWFIPARRPSARGSLLYQRNIEKLSKDRAALGQEIRESVAELFDAAVESGAAIAIKSAPDQHAEQPPRQRRNPDAPARRVKHRHLTGIDQTVHGLRISRAVRPDSQVTPARHQAVAACATCPDASGRSGGVTSPMRAVRSVR